MYVVWRISYSINATYVHAVERGGEKKGKKERAPANSVVKAHEIIIEDAGGVKRVRR